jgi:hypothetical protein
MPYYRCSTCTAVTAVSPKQRILESRDRNYTSSYVHLRHKLKALITITIATVTTCMLIKTPEKCMVLLCTVNSLLSGPLNVVAPGPSIQATLYVLIKLPLIRTPKMCPPPPPPQYPGHSPRCQSVKWGYTIRMLFPIRAPDYRKPTSCSSNGRDYTVFVKEILSTWLHNHCWLARRNEISNGTCSSQADTLQN